MFTALVPTIVLRIVKASLGLTLLRLKSLDWVTSSAAETVKAASSRAQAMRGRRVLDIGISLSLSAVAVKTSGRLDFLGYIGAT